MKTALILGGREHSLADVHTVLSVQLDFPACYGRNLDALYDCLTDISRETEIRLCGTAALSKALGRDYARLCRTLLLAAEENPRLHIRI